MIFSLCEWCDLADGLHNRLHDGGGVPETQLEDVSGLGGDAEQMDDGNHDVLSL